MDVILPNILVRHEVAIKYWGIEPRTPATAVLRPTAQGPVVESLIKLILNYGKLEVQSVFWSEKVVTRVLASKIN